jgi:hypothetical protein
MLGFALDPNFRVNGYIYVLYVVDRYYLLHFGDPDYDPNANAYFDATIGRLTRYTCRSSDGFRSVDRASRQILIGETKQTGIPICSDTHGVGSLVFGEDETLLVSCGDGGTAHATDLGGPQPLSYAPQALADGIIRPKEDVGAFRAQLVDSLNGKVLRIDPATGNGLPSNPYYDAANPRAPRSRVWALGLRNPYRMSLRPNTGSHFPADGNPGILYVGHVGWNTWEALDVVTGPRQNFGWPTYEGMSINPGQGGVDYNVDIANQDAPNPLYPGAGESVRRFTDDTEFHTAVSPHQTGAGLESRQRDHTDADLRRLWPGADSQCGSSWLAGIRNTVPRELRHRRHLVHGHELSGGLSESILFCRLGSGVDQDPHVRRQRQAGRVK